uniref:Cytochrome P450 n=1 Tax=Daucus carota subsp. sativus TaxID=79200 RepID=A0A161ZZ04_DAUCS
MGSETWFYLLSVMSIYVFLFYLTKHQKQSRNTKNPPSPPSLPIIGHLHLIKDPLHRMLQDLSCKYGPIFRLKFGYRAILVISSQSGAEECFTKHDISFANRPRLLVGKHLNYNYTTIAAASYGQHWRNLRRLSAIEMFSTNRLNMFLSVRREETGSLIKNLCEEVRGDSVKVKMQPRLSELSFNIIMRMICGKRYFGVEVENQEEARKLAEMIKEAFDLAGASNPGDFLSFLQWIDFGGLEKRMKRVHSTNDAFLQSVIDESRQKSGSGKTKTLVDVMLSLQEGEPEDYSDEILKGMILVR